jgi:hypothetical protein
VPPVSLAEDPYDSNFYIPLSILRNRSLLVHGAHQAH